MIALVIYLSGIVAAVILFYLSLEKGYKVTIFDLVFGILISLFSWAAFIIFLLIVYNDKVVFIKK